LNGLDQWSSPHAVVAAQPAIYFTTAALPTTVVLLLRVIIDRRRSIARGQLGAAAASKGRPQPSNIQANKWRGVSGEWALTRL